MTFAITVLSITITTALLLLVVVALASGDQW